MQLLPPGMQHHFNLQAQIEYHAAAAAGDGVHSNLQAHADLVTTRALYGTAHDMAKCLMRRMRTSKTTGAAGSPTRAGQTKHPTTALQVSPMSVQVRADNR